MMGLGLGCVRHISALPPGSMLGLDNRGCHRDWEGVEEEGTRSVLCFGSCITPAMPLHLRQFIPVAAAEFTWRFFQHLENQRLHVPVGTLVPAGALSSESPLVLAHVPPLSSEMPAHNQHVKRAYGLKVFSTKKVNGEVRWKRFFKKQRKPAYVSPNARQRDE